MSIIESIILSLALAMDCFSIAFTCGIIEKRFHLSQALPMALLFGLFQALMPLIGWGASSFFYAYIENFAPIIAFVLLALIGGKMVWGSLHGEEERPFNPNRPLTLIYLAVATSIDALAIGITFTCIGLESAASVATPLALIALGAFLLTLAGKAVGVFIGKRFEFKAELVGGIILILLGIKILVAG